MVDNDSREMAGGAGIGTIVDILFRATSHANIAYHDVVSIRIDCVVTQRDAWSGGRLSQYGGVGADIEITL